MKIKSAVFTTSAPDLASCPTPVLPEFAFIGRSNVGKSSLLNLLAEKKDLARVSDLPGKTRLLNFFTINERWSLVDLPGYGYAKVAKTDRIEFNTAVRDYLGHRPSLRCVFALIDSRLAPQEIDLRFVHWLGAHEVPFALVFTKIDKQSAQTSRNTIEQFQRAMAASTDAQPPVFATSATTKSGRSELLGFIEQSLAGKTAAKKPAAPPPPADPEFGDELE
ncbi:MAG: engB [Lacunisphaera sp.]|jgi:GTP-binding protein|nr:engB [Lacunisphaera sp.]